MREITLKFSNKELKTYDHYLSRRFGKGKSIENKIRKAILECVSMEAGKELEEVNKEIAELK